MHGEQNATYPALPLLILMTLTLTLGVSGCDSAESKARQATSLRSERRLILDTLYAEYGGSTLARGVVQEVAGMGHGKAEHRFMAEGMANLAQGVDREIFEAFVRSVGQGEPVLLLTEHSKSFFSRNDVIRLSQRVCELDIILASLGGS